MFTLLRTLFTKLFGSRNQRVVKRLRKSVDAINHFESELENLSDAALTAKADEFKQRLSNGESLDDLLSEAFAVVREAGKRIFGMRHYDVQMIGGMVLHQGKIPEMRTGEGKTLVATLAVYLNALSGKGVHVITVNDYLAKRDAEWMGKLYNFLGLSVGVVLSGQDHEEKQAAYAADITYGTNNEFGFDYLRDNMAMDNDYKVQRGHYFAVVDEVDSILIDEARTPLIISGPTDDDPQLYAEINKIVPKLAMAADEEAEGDFVLDEKGKQVHMTEAGHENVEKLFVNAGLLSHDESLYDPSNIALLHHLNACIRATHIYQKNVEYIVRNGEVIIVDEFTGRVMPGRRWSDGLHQALEAKEGVQIQRENHTLASITFQNYFRLYEKLSGMTGTADTEAFEFQEIYGLEVVVIPTNKPTVRNDMPDRVYLTAAEKFDAIVVDIKEVHKTGQPILVGTASIEVSEHISQLLQKAGIKHSVLNAKQHASEAQIIEDAGLPAAVTIATNMAGRGTDIVLGGNLEAELSGLEKDTDISKAKADWQIRHQRVKDAGGLFVMGTERHESRRIDNQLRGRAGRQGDPGASLFYLSLEDSLMRIFASPRMTAFMQKIGLEKGEAIEHGLVSRAIENAQRKVESHNFDIRKNLLEYDDVANDQRKVMYEQRDALLSGEGIESTVSTIVKDIITGMVQGFVPPGSVEEQWDLAGLSNTLQQDLGLERDVAKWIDEQPNLDTDDVVEWLLAEWHTEYDKKEQTVGDEAMRSFEKSVLIQVQDKCWKEHLAAMDYLRQGIHLRGYAQKNPKQEYKREAFQLFTQMLDRIKHESVSLLSRVQVRSQEEIEALEEQRREAALAAEKEAQATHAAANSSAEVETTPAEPEPAASQPQIRQTAKVGRNEPCPCGSGKKYKQCHGKPA